MKVKIVILDGFLVNPGDITWDEIERFGELTVYDVTEEKDIIDRIGGAEVVFVNRCGLTKDVFETCKQMKFVGILGTGFNAVDIVAAKEHGVTVCNIPAYSTRAVAQITMALLLEVTNKVATFDRYVKTNGWKSLTDPNLASIQKIELWGKTMGIIGMGDIGYTVATIAEALGMEVFGYRRNPKKELETEHIHYADLDTVLKNADVLSLHCPMNEETTGLINKDTIAKMKNGAILLNTARGGIINEQDVADALDSGKLLALGTDVLSTEPPKADNPLPNHPNVVLTPHVAWTPKETRIRLLKMSGENLQKYLDGNPIHVVNP